MRDAVLVTNGDSEMGQVCNIQFQTCNRTRSVTSISCTFFHQITKRKKSAFDCLQLFFLLIWWKQMVILPLIVKRVRVKTLVKDKRAAMDAFGTYVEVTM